MDVKVKWNGAAFASKVQGNLQQNLKKAGFFGVNQLKRALNRTQPMRTYRSRQGIVYVGLSPSLPGEYPKKLSGKLQRSMAFTVVGDVLTIGSTLTKPNYPRFLQNGTRKMAARPWMTLFWKAHSTVIGRIILTGK